MVCQGLPVLLAEAPKMKAPENLVGPAEAGRILGIERQSVAHWLKPEVKNDPQILPAQDGKVDPVHCKALKAMADSQWYGCKPHRKMLSRAAMLEFILKAAEAVRAADSRILELEPMVNKVAESQADLFRASPSSKAHSSSDTNSASTEQLDTTNMTSQNVSNSQSERTPASTDSPSAQSLKEPSSSNQQHDDHVRCLKRRMAHGYLPTEEERMRLPRLARANLSIWDIAFLIGESDDYVQEYVIRSSLTLYQTGYDPLEIFIRRKAFNRELVILYYESLEFNENWDEQTSRYHEENNSAPRLIGMRVWDLMVGSRDPRPGYICHGKVKMVTWEDLLCDLGALTNNSVEELVRLIGLRFLGD